MRLHYNIPNTITAGIKKIFYATFLIKKIIFVNFLKTFTRTPNMIKIMEVEKLSSCFNFHSPYKNMKLPYTQCKKRKHKKINVKSTNYKHILSSPLQKFPHTRYILIKFKEFLYAAYIHGR